MSKLISGDELRKRIESTNGLIERAVSANVEGIKYDFQLSSLILHPRLKAKVDIAKLKPLERATICVEPGETVFVMTEEILHLPRNIKAEISHKRKLAHEGILVLGGFCIDPLYEGHLIFGLYNFSSRPFVLEPGKKLVAAQFYQLEDSELSRGDEKPQPINEFPKELENMIDAFHASSLLQLESQIKEMRVELQSLRKDFDSQNEWFGKFQKGIDELRDVLERERQERINGEGMLSKLCAQHETTLGDLSKSKITMEVHYKLMRWVIAVLFGGVAVALTLYYLCLT